MAAAANGIERASGLAIFDYALVRAVINLVVLFGAYIGFQLVVVAVIARSRS